MNTHSLRTVQAPRGLALLVVLNLIGCSGISHSDVADVANVANNNQPSNSDTAMEDQKRPASDIIDSRLVSANTRFGFKLFAEIAKQDAGKNVFISPASIGSALAMTYIGAVGETKDAMTRVLETQGMTHADLNQAYAQLKAALESPDPNVQLSIANSLWAKKGITFNPEFLQRNNQFYGAEVTALDFGDPSAPNTINSWVAGKTKGKIDKMVDRIDPQSILFLINAIYFKGKWTDEFDKAKTREETFTTRDDMGGLTSTLGQKRHPMMHQSGKYRYNEGNDFQAVSLPYAAGRVSMYIFLPAKGTSLAEFQKKLTATTWEAWMKEFKETPGEIAVPRFKIEYEIGLNDALKALGMGVAFDPDRANFTGIVQGAQNAFISRVKHKTFAEVNEEGTEAAAATSVEMSVTSAMRPVRSFRMIVDHPFFCAIRDNKTGTVLFMGSITNPI